MLSITKANEVILPAKAVTINGHRVTKGKALVWLTRFHCQWSLEGGTLAITDTD